MTEQEPHMSNELLAKYFAGELTTAQAEAVKQWAASSAGNREQLEMLHVLWLDTGVVEMYETPVEVFDDELAWKKVKAKKESFVKQQGSGGSRWVLRVAASVALLLAFAYLLKIYLFDPAQQEFVAVEGVEMLELADGSRVTLNKSSTLTYPEDFAAGERAVRLKGEAFFEVEHNPERPFVVQAAATTIEVLGTSFNVALDGGTVEVAVETGKVRFSAAGEELILTAGQRGVFSTMSETVRLSEEAPASGVTQYWKTRRLVFAGSSLAEVVATLEKAFGVDIRLANDALANCSLTVTFESDTLENMLDVIALTLDLKITREGDTILLSGIGCPVK